MSEQVRIDVVAGGDTKAITDAERKIRDLHKAADEYDKRGMVATPQSYRPSKDRFVKKTGYAIGQFDERILKTLNLSNELCREDLLSIAKIHFPDLATPYLEYVVENTLATQRNYVSDIEKIAALSRVCADQAGRKVPSLADIKSAIADVLPTAADLGKRLQKICPAKPMQPPCEHPACPTSAPAVRCGIQPIFQATSGKRLLLSCPHKALDILNQ